MPPDVDASAPGPPEATRAARRAATRAAHQPRTIHDLEQMKALIEMGVDGIMTDRPTLLEEVLAASGG